MAPDDDHPPTRWARGVVFVLVFIPWLVLYEWVVYRGPRSAAFQTFLPGEMNWPIWPWMEVFYVSPYLLVPLVPLVVRTNRVLRRFVIAALCATALVQFIFLTVPAIAPPRPFTPSGLLGQMMLIDRRLDRNNGTAAFPSFHVVWAFLGASVFVQCLPCGFSRLRAACWIWAIGVAASCVFTGMHSVADVVAGFATFLLVYHYKGVGEWLRRNPAQAAAPCEVP
jgi:membrane-associated phospholipid phosphatase